MILCYGSPSRLIYRPPKSLHIKGNHTSLVMDSNEAKYSTLPTCTGLSSPLTDYDLLSKPNSNFTAVQPPNSLVAQMVKHLPTMQETQL